MSFYKDFMLEKMCCLRSTGLSLKNDPRSKVAVSKRNLKSDLVYTIHRKGVRTWKVLSVVEEQNPLRAPFNENG